MQMTAAQLAQFLNGQVEGNPDAIINHPCKIEEGQPGGLTFLANPKYEDYLYDTQATAVLVQKDFVPKQKVQSTLIRVPNVQAAMSELMQHFETFLQKDRSHKSGISAQAQVHKDAQIHETATIGAFAVIQSGAVIGSNTHIHAQAYVGHQVHIGNDCVIHPGVRILDDCILGDRCTIHANAIIGADGFGYALNEDGSYRKIPQLGNVILEEDVEIGANATIDRAVMGSTLLRKGVKIDNLVMIAHNVQIGAHTAVAAQAGIAGSTKVGSGCRIGGQVGIVGHIEVADRISVQAQSGINKSLDQEGSAWYGSPALPYRDYLRAYAVFRKLPALEQTIHKLQKKIKRLLDN